jgi:NodT family efflux transporter outer membrane factor (OMF) lipoprotein
MKQNTYNYHIGILSIIAMASLSMISGCTVGPDYTRPVLHLPDQWTAATDSTAADPNLLSQWWTTFDDATLNSLIDLADANNLDLKAALARIDQSRALRAYAAGENLPTVNAVGSYTRSRVSKHGPYAPADGSTPDPASLYSAGFDAAWEIDLFGRIRRSVESAQATLEQSIEDFRSVRISLYAEVARNYIELRTAQARIHYAAANIEIQRKTLELAQNRFDLEIAPSLDVAQARLNLANTESEIPSLRITENAALNRLAVLTGTTPYTLREALVHPEPLPSLESVLTAGLPAELLRRRPDIRSAERALASQTARIGAAQAQRYPSFSLFGTLELQASHISNLGDWSSRAYAFGPGLRWNLFDGNRLQSLVNVEESRTRELAAAYEASVLRAMEEVENALVGYVQENERLEALRRSVDAARKSVEMVETLYKSGLTDFQNVLDSQRSLFVQEDRLAISEGLILKQVVELYKSLGGGWDFPNR